MRWNETKLTFESFENNVLSTKVFLHGWAAKKLYFDAVRDRVISGKDSIDLQVTFLFIIFNFQKNGIHICMHTGFVCPSVIPFSSIFPLLYYPS